MKELMEFSEFLDLQIKNLKGLKESGVIFDELNHTYTLGEKILNGITGILSKHVFPKKYDDVPEHILKTAAERGSLIHSEIQMYESCFPASNPTQETENYIKLKKEIGFDVIASEYIVTDTANFASPIDLVLNYNDKLYLCDIKTTSVLDKEYLSWQLSIYKYLFELQNEVKVDGLCGIHLKNDVKEFVEVSEIDREIIASLLLAEVMGLEFENPLKKISETEEQLLSKVYDIENQLIVWENEIKAQKELQLKYKEELMRLMDERGIKKLESDKLILTRKEDGKRVSLDSKAIKEELPDVYEKYAKESTVKGSILIKIK